MWQCKDCGVEVSRRSEILKHYRLQHSHFGRGHHIKCIYPDCPCVFKTWNSLLTHLSRNHNNTLKQSDIFTAFSCHLCGCSELGTEHDYFVHISHHLKNNETVTCMFKGCEYKSNVYSTFKSHKSRKHGLHSLVDFKDGVVTRTGEPDVSNSEEFCDESQSDIDLDKSKDQPEIIEQKIAAVLLKLENIFHVPSAAIDELLEEFQYLLSTASLCSTRNVIHDTLNSYKLQVDQSVIEELASALCTSNPVYKSIGKGCPLATSFKRKKYYKDNFQVVEPIEYILDDKTKRTLQYVPLLKFLKQLFTNDQILNKALDSHLISECRGEEVIYKSFRDDSDNTIILPHSDNELRACAWPREFPIPRFPYNVEVQLQRGNERFRETGTQLKITPGLKSDILEKLAEEIFQYTAYPQNYQIDEVAGALIKNFPV
ncbi:uncharacterized protein LOC114569461 [Perca flavescens]|uniref:uncharacterized protein LOC114569461 n=1 Tax=Perca flavescens TaxID=8167 RepID=UPI00106E9B21|nr:uncharacterized protein LOC114569461 [Perca flavescens]